MNRLAIAAAIAALTSAGSASAAVTLTGNAPSAVVPYVGAFTYDFDVNTPVFAGGAVITTGTTPDLYAQPHGSVDNYFAAGPSTSEPATIFLPAGGASAITFLMGSVDSYNTLTFIDGGGNVLATFLGSDIATPADGNQTSPATNRILTFTFTGDDRFNIAGMVLNSNGQNAFEIDSITLTALPEPTTWGMMIGGFGVVGGALRRRNTKARVRFA